MVTVRRRDVKSTQSQFPDSDGHELERRVITHTLEWAAGHGIPPEQAELLRRQIKDAYWGEDVSGLLRGEDPKRVSFAAEQRVFWRLDSWLARWVRALEQRVGAQHCASALYGGLADPDLLDRSRALRAAKEHA
jgi:hypothetical protein